MRDRKASKKRRRSRKRLRVLIAVGSVVGVLLIGVLIDSALYYNKVHTGVSVSGISLGGLTRDEATATLDRLVQRAQKEPVTLTSGEKKWAILPGDVGTQIDVKAAVTAAMDASRKGNFLVDLVRRCLLYFHGKDIPLGGTVDPAKVDAVLAGVAKELDMPPVNAGLVVDNGKIQEVAGQKGRIVDQASLRQQLEQVLLTLHATEIAVPMVMKEPVVQAEDSRKALAQAATMISGPVTLAAGAESWTLSAEQIAAYMDFTSVDQGGVSTLVPFLSADKMRPFLEEVGAAVEKDAVDASFKGDGKKAWVVPAVTGKALDPEGTAKALTTAALNASDRSAQATMVITQPHRTTAEAEAMGIKEKLGSFTTKWEGTPDRQTNVRITTEYASNVILAPGDIYDFNQQIGPRTAERGYKLAPGIVGPGRLEDVFGGGICQVSTTLFNAAFFAGLDIVERKNHSIYIDHYPKGRDATVSADGPNLRFRNDTAHYILVRGTSDGITTTFVIYGTDEGRTVSYTTSDFYDVVDRTVVTYPLSTLGPGTTVIKTPGQAGRSITVVRVVKAKDGSVIHKDTFISTWKMIPQEIQVGTGKTTTTTSKSSTTTKTTTSAMSTTTDKPGTGSTGTSKPT